MRERGDYRSFYCAFWDDPDIHALSDAAYRVLTTLKGTLPASGIGVVYLSQLADRCGKPAEEIEAALVELEQPKDEGAFGWIVRERNIVWVVNGLRFEPTMNRNNSKHRTFIRERHLAPLGERAIVEAFRRYYADWFEGAAPTPNNAIEESSSDAYRIGIDSASKHSPVQSSPVHTKPDQSEAAADNAGADDARHVPDEPALTALFLAVCANRAVTERWGEQTNPYMQGSAASLEAELRAAGVPPEIARLSFYRQCRESKLDEPPRTINYFRPGITDDWDAEQTRRAGAASGERAPPRRAKRASAHADSASPAVASAYADRLKPR